MGREEAKIKTLLVYFNLDGFAVQIQRHIAAALEELQIEWRECFIKDVAEASREFQPVMTLFFHPNHKIYMYQDVIRGLGGHKLLWSMEDPYESDLTFDMLSCCYFIFTSDESTAKALDKEAGGDRIYYVPHACNPKVHRSMRVPYEYRSDILFVGNAYESRLKFFRDCAEEYKDKMVTIIGVGYRGLDGYQYQKVIHGHISEEEHVKYINGAKLVLNLHRQITDVDVANKRRIPADHLNNRFYEVMACGKQQFVVGRPDKQKSVPQLHEFDPEKESYKARLVKYYLPLLK